MAKHNEAEQLELSWLDSINTVKLARRTHLITHEKQTPLGIRLSGVFLWCQREFRLRLEDSRQKVDYIKL
jgi:hypothetical protein